jgi:hypothetical protein
MATKQFYATGSFKYGTRMLRAGDPVEMDEPNARLFTALRKISPKAPPETPAPDQMADETTVVEKPKRAPRKRTAAKKKRG